MGGPRFPHTPITTSLVHRYRELCDLRGYRESSMIALMSLYGNSKTSLKAGNAALNEERRLALECIPYYNGGKQRKIDMNSRDRSIKLFNMLKKNLTQEMINDDLERVRSKHEDQPK